MKCPKSSATGADLTPKPRVRSANNSKTKADTADASRGKVTAKKEIVLLSGGNPQIAKGDGDAPVQNYIAAMPGWKHEIGKRLDAIIVENVPEVRKAVRWNSPFYGIDGKGWFVSFHVLTRYVKVTFFSGMSLEPIPPGGTPKSKQSRWIDIHETDELNEEQLSSWMKQACRDTWLDPVAAYFRLLLWLGAAPAL